MKKLLSGSFYQGVDFEILARVPDPVGVVLVPGDIASYTVDIYDVTEGDGQDSPVFSLSSSTSSEVLFAALQTDGRWTADSLGYNFKYLVDVSALLPVVLKGGRRYRVEIWMTSEASPTNDPTGDIPVIAEVTLIPTIKKR